MALASRSKITVHFYFLQNTHAHKTSHEGRLNIFKIVDKPEDIFEPHQGCLN